MSSHAGLEVLGFVDAFGETEGFEFLSRIAARLGERDEHLRILDQRLDRAQPERHPRQLVGVLLDERGDDVEHATDYLAGMTDRFAIEEHRKLFHLDVVN